jgi:hypothetical protein
VGRVGSSSREDLVGVGLLVGAAADGRRRLTGGPPPALTDAVRTPVQ